MPSIELPGGAGGNFGALPITTTGIGTFASVTIPSTGSISNNGYFYFQLNGVATGLNFDCTANAAAQLIASSGASGYVLLQVGSTLALKLSTTAMFGLPIAWNAMVPNAGLFALAMTDANQTLTNVQYNNQVLRLTGTLTAQRNIVMPLVAGAAVLVNNATTGGFGLQVIGASGTGVVVAAGTKVWCFSDGTNWY